MYKRQALRWVALAGIAVASLVAIGTTVLVAADPVSYTHLRAHETVLDIVCRLLLETKTRTTDGKHPIAVHCTVGDYSHIERDMIHSQ